MCMRARFGVYKTDMHACSCKLSCTYLVHMSALMRASILSISRAHACICANEMKNVSCWVHDTHVLSQV